MNKSPKNVSPVEEQNGRSVNKKSSREVIPVKKENTEDTAPVRDSQKTGVVVPYVSDAEKSKKKSSADSAKNAESKNTSVYPDDFVRVSPSPDQGLNEEQIADRVARGYVNSAPKKFSKSYGSIFAGNICTFFNLLCLVAAVALALARAPLSQFMFVVIFTCNICIGIIQEIRAKKKIDKLSILSAPTAKVVRCGKEREIPVNELVVDDVLYLSAGQQVPADCIKLNGNADLNESLLTGESVPVKKEDGDMLFAGSFVSSGKSAVRVEKIGSDTYISNLTARAKKYKRPNSEIINSINLFIKLIGLAIVPVAIFMFFTNFKSAGLDWADISARGGFWNVLFSGDSGLNTTIQKTCSVVIGMIPSGLLLLTTVAMSVGMIRLARYNTLVQDMYSLEMLARVNVLCLDKTGTITDGRMKVSDCIILNNPTEFAIDDILGSMLSALEDNNQTSISLGERFGRSSALQATAKLPFSSVKKYSAVSFGDLGTFVLGAPEFVLKPMPLRVEKLVKQYAQMGLRVLVVAHSLSQIQGEKVPVILRPVCVITLSDNIRPDAIETIKWFKENDVAVKVISGDNPMTVSEVARRAGIDNASQFISLEGLSDPEVEAAANEYTVFGRVTPEQKAILVRSIKKTGSTVAMTGDGVNDILAMKEADCAVSVATGSEAARNVSNLVLQDNNFANMPRIVNEGRRVINNIKDSASLYIMKTLLTLILAIVCISTGSTYFFTTNNMMLYELFISAIPSFVLSLQPNTARVRGKFIPFVVSRALPGALTLSCAILSMYVINQSSLKYVFDYTNELGETVSLYDAMLMLTLTCVGLVMLWNICKPLNLVRTVLFAFTVALCVVVLSIPLFGELVYSGWSALDFNVTQILLLAVVIQAAIPVSAGLIKFFDMFNPADD